MYIQRYYIKDGKCITSYICVKSHNLSSVVVVLCHVGPTLSSLVAGNVLVIYVELSFRIKKIYVPRQIMLPDYTINKDK